MVKYFIKISQESEVGSKKSYNVSEDGSVITIQRPLYNNLKSLVHNTTVTIPENEVGTGFIQFLKDMSILHDIKYNGSTDLIPDGIEILDEYLGESRFDINLTGDTLSVYDLYLSKAADTFNVWKHDEEKCRDEDVIWKDPVNSDVIHVDMTKDVASRLFETAVVKYFYIPTSDFDELYMSNDVYISLEAAIAAAVYDMLHDIEKASQQRAAFTRKGQAIVEPYPQDYSDPGKPSMFPPGV